MSVIINGGVIIKGGVSINTILENQVSEVPIIFGSLVNWEENPSGYWRPIATGANGSGKSSQYLPGDGYIQSDITENLGTLNNLNIGVGFSLDNAQVPDYIYDYLLYVEGANGHYKTYDNTNGYVDTGVTASTGDKIRTQRINDTLYALYYRGSWIPLYTFPDTTIANLYIYGSSYDVGTIEYLVNPLGFGLI